MTDQMRKALEAARQFIVNGVELGYITMPDADTPDSAHATLPMIEAALASAQQADHIGDVSEMVAAPVVPEEWRQALLALADRIEAADEQQIAISRTGADILRAILVAHAPEQRDRVELTDAEIEERWWGELDNRSLSSIRAVIAAHEAKQPTGSGPVAGTVYDPASGGVA